MAQRWTYSADNLKQIARGPTVPIGATTGLVYPANSITMLVLPAVP